MPEAESPAAAYICMSSLRSENHWKNMKQAKSYAEE